MGLYKICKHKGRDRDRCAHAWWGSFRGRRESLSKWFDVEIQTKAEAKGYLDKFREQIRRGAADQSGVRSLTFSQLAERYRREYVDENGLSVGKSRSRRGTNGNGLAPIDYSLKPLGGVW